MKLSTDQKRILERLTEAHQELVYDRGMARIRLQELVNKELVTKERVQSKIANDALEAGVPKSQVGLAMGTRDWNLINRVIDLTREEREVEAEIAKPKDPWTFDAEANIVTVYEASGEGTPWSDWIGEYTVPVRWVDTHNTWTYETDPDRPKPVSWSLGQEILPALNAMRLGLPDPAPVAESAAVAEDTYAAFGYAPPQAWSPEDDEKDASEW